MAKAPTRRDNHPAMPAHRDRPPWTDICLAIFTGLLLLVTAGQLYLFSHQTNLLTQQTSILADQRKEMEKQRGEMVGQREEMAEAGKQTDKIIAEDRRLADANERLAKGMTDSVAQAKASLKVTIDQSRKSLDKTIEMSRSDQRAWVGAGDPLVVQFKDSSMRVSVTIQNFGRTPALNVVPQIHVRSLPASESFAPSLPAKPTDPDTRAALQPGQKLTLGPNEVPPITIDLANEINSGKTCFYAFGEVFYDDAFGEAHCTTFAYMLLPALSAWRVLDKYNTAD